MNTQTVESPIDRSDELKGYANELAAAQKRLQAPASDLAILLNLILDNISPTLSMASNVRCSEGVKF